MTLAIINRRLVLMGLTALALAPWGPANAAGGLPKMKVMRDPSCGCCGAWIEHLRQAGFAVEVVEIAHVNRVKAKFGVPQALAACHTGEIAGYVIEGHVPAGAIKRLLAERPQARGLAVPGMPVGSPGMEVEGAEPETYEVILFGPGQQRSFARFRGAQVI